MDAVRIAIGCAVTALVVGSGLSRLSPEARDNLLASARSVVGGAASASRPTMASGPVRTVVASAAPAQGPAGFAEVIRANAGGQWQTMIEVEGERLPVLVDTGATFVSLSFEDADRLGIRPSPADFRLPMSTANGQTYAARVRLRSVRLGSIELRDVDAIVAGRGQMGVTLLGMSFLSRLAGVAVDHGELMLRQ